MKCHPVIILIFILLLAVLGCWSRADAEAWRRFEVVAMDGSARLIECQGCYVTSAQGQSVIRSFGGPDILSCSGCIVRLLP